MYDGEYCSVCGIKFDKDKEDQNSGRDVNVKMFGLDFCGWCCWSLPYNFILVANKKLGIHINEYGTWTFDNFKKHPKLKLRPKPEYSKKSKVVDKNKTQESTITIDKELLIDSLCEEFKITEGKMRRAINRVIKKKD
jgi:hypothetical protein